MSVVVGKHKLEVDDSYDEANEVNGKHYSYDTNSNEEKVEIHVDYEYLNNMSLNIFLKKTKTLKIVIDSDCCEEGYDLCPRGNEFVININGKFIASIEIVHMDSLDDRYCDNGNQDGVYPVTINANINVEKPCEMIKTKNIENVEYKI